MRRWVAGEAGDVVLVIRRLGRGLDMIGWTATRCIMDYVSTSTATAIDQYYRYLQSYHPPSPPQSQSLSLYHHRQSHSHHAPTQTLDSISIFSPGRSLLAIQMQNQDRSEGQNTHD